MQPQEDLLLTCGSDGSLCLHSTLQRVPLRVLSPPCSGGLTGVAWSPSRPMVLATATGEGGGGSLGQQGWWGGL